MSSDTAIRFRNVGKCYRVGAAQSGSNFRYKSLGERMGQFARHPLRSIGGGGAVNDDEFWALRDVSFDVPRGEVVGVIGRNGAGKSTLLKILSQITKPSEGEIEVQGRVGSLLEVGTGFHPELTGRENVFLNGSILGMTRREVKRKFDEIVAFSEVERFLETPVKQYSSGMYTRLAFAVAAHLDPEILVVDEVLAVGDAEFQKKCLGKMQDVSRGGRTVLFVSHNMSAITSLCTSAAWLQNGQLKCVGEINDVVAQYSRPTSSEDSDLTHVDRAILNTPKPSIRRLTIGSESGMISMCKANERVTFDIELAPTVSFPSAVMSIALSNEHGTRVLMFHTDYHSRLMFPLRKESGNFKVQCQTEKLPLRPGDYTVELTLADGNGVLLERIDNAALLTVQCSNMLSTGTTPRLGQGDLVVPAKWSAHLPEPVSTDGGSN